MANYIINAILILLTAWLINKIPCCRNSRGEAALGELTVEIGRTIYTVTCYFKKKGATASEKIFKLMENELEISENICYNKIKSQKSLDVSDERSSL